MQSGNEYKPKHQDFLADKNKRITDSDHNYREERSRLALSSELVPYCLSQEEVASYFYQQDTNYSSKHPKTWYELSLFPDFDFYIRPEILEIIEKGDKFYFKKQDGTLEQVKYQAIYLGRSENNNIVVTAIHANNMSVIEREIPLTAPSNFTIENLGLYKDELVAHTVPFIFSADLLDSNKIYLTKSDEGTLQYTIKISDEILWQQPTELDAPDYFILSELIRFKSQLFAIAAQREHIYFPYVMYSDIACSTFTHVTDNTTTEDDFWIEEGTVGLIKMADGTPEFISPGYRHRLTSGVELCGIASVEDAVIIHETTAIIRVRDGELMYVGESACGTRGGFKLLLPGTFRIYSFDSFATVTPIIDPYGLNIKVKKTDEELDIERHQLRSKLRTIEQFNLKQSLEKKKKNPDLSATPSKTSAHIEFEEFNLQQLAAQNKKDSAFSEISSRSRKHIEYTNNIEGWSFINRTREELRSCGVTYLWTLDELMKLQDRFPADDLIRWIKNHFSYQIPSDLVQRVNDYKWTFFPTNIEKTKLCNDIALWMTRQDRGKTFDHLRGDAAMPSSLFGYANNYSYFITEGFNRECMEKERSYNKELNKIYDEQIKKSIDVCRLLFVNVPGGNYAVARNLDLDISNPNHVWIYPAGLNKVDPSLEFCYRGSSKEDTLTITLSDINTQDSLSVNVVAEVGFRIVDPYLVTMKFLKQNIEPRQMLDTIKGYMATELKAQVASMVLNSDEEECKHEHTLPPSLDDQGEALVTRLNDLPEFKGESKQESLIKVTKAKVTITPSNQKVQKTLEESQANAVRRARQAFLTTLEEKVKAQDQLIQAQKAEIEKVKQGAQQKIDQETQQVAKTLSSAKSDKTKLFNHNKEAQEIYTILKSQKDPLEKMEHPISQSTCVLFPSSAETVGAAPLTQPENNHRAGRPSPLRVVVTE